MKKKITKTFIFLILVICFGLKSCENEIKEIISEDLNVVELLLTHQKGVEKTIGKAIYKKDHYDLQTTSIQLLLSYQNIRTIRTNIIEQNRTFLKNNLIIEYQYCEVTECFGERRFTFRNVSLNVESISLALNNIEYLSNRSFYGMRNLKELIISNNKLIYIESFAFESLANLVRLDLSRNTQLTTIHSNAFLGLERLRFIKMSSSKLSTITENTFSHLRSLENLDLRISLSLKEIKNYGFNDLNNLLSLDLSMSSSLSFIEDRSFYGLVRLKSLFLRQTNNLNFASMRKIFRNLKQLEILEIERLNLENMESDLFVDLNSLKILYLLNCKITHIRNAFKGLHFLEELSLENNNLAALNAHSLFSLNHTQLKKLNLNNCKIRNIEMGAFYGLENLLELSLGSNYLFSIEPFIFVGLTNLKSLILNSLLTVDKTDLNSFYGLENLKHLDLYSTSFKIIRNSSFLNLNGLQSLRMGVLNDKDVLEIMPHGLQHFQNLFQIDFSAFPSVHIRERAFVNFSPKHERVDMKFQVLKFIQSIDLDIYNFCGLFKLRPAVNVKSIGNIHFFTSSNLNIVDESSFRNDPRFNKIKNPICYLTLFFIRFELLFKFYNNDDVNRFFFDCLTYELEENFFIEKDCENIK